MLCDVKHTLEGIFSGDYECLNAPMGEVEPGEVVLGVLEDEKAKAIFSALVDVRRAGSRFIEDIDFNNLKELSDESQNKIINKLVRFRGHADILNSLFWQIVHDQFPDSRNPNVTSGIRKNWQIVIFKSQQLSIFDVLRNIME